MDCVSISVARTQRQTDCRPVRIDFASGGGLDSHLQRFRGNSGDQFDLFATVDLAFSFLFSLTVAALCRETKFQHELFRGTFGCPISRGASVVQFAVFADAGCLHVQGSALMAGQQQPRTVMDSTFRLSFLNVAGRQRPHAPKAAQHCAGRDNTVNLPCC